MITYLKSDNILLFKSSANRHSIGLSNELLSCFFRCSTCVENAQKGQAGYCRKKMRPQKSWSHNTKPRKHFGRPTTSENWGLCSIQCSPVPMNLRANKLQVYFL